MLPDDRVNLITAGCNFEGTIEFDGYTRFDGTIRGTLKAGQGSELILGENGVVEGTIHGDSVVIDGFVRGDVFATSKVVIGETGRLIGKIHSPKIAVKFGGFFEGSCKHTAVESIPTPTANA